jgi:predicted nucleotidyltransferase
MIDFPKLLRLLTEHDVAFIIIGGVAAVIHGSSRLTQDLDIVYHRSPQNLARLVQALAEQSPYLRGAPPGLPFQWSVATLRMGLNFTLETSVGPLDLLGEVTGGGSYEDLLEHTIEVEIFGVQCRCLGLPALIRTKRAAGRPKDLEAIAELEVIWEEQQEG